MVKGWESVFRQQSWPLFSRRKVCGGSREERNTNIVTQDRVQFFCMKCTREQKLYLVKKQNGSFFSFIHLQGKKIWNTFLVKKNKLALPYYQSMGVFDQQNESQASLNAFCQKSLPVQMKVQTSTPKYFDSAVIIFMLIPTNCKKFLQ